MVRPSCGYLHDILKATKKRMKELIKLKQQLKETFCGLILMYIMKELRVIFLFVICLNKFFLYKLFLCKI